MKIVHGLKVVLTWAACVGLVLGHANLSSETLAGTSKREEPQLGPQANTRMVRRSPMDPSKLAPGLQDLARALSNQDSSVSGSINSAKLDYDNIISQMTRHRNQLAGWLYPGGNLAPASTEHASEMEKLIQMIKMDAKTAREFARQVPRNLWKPLNPKVRWHPDNGFFVQRKNYDTIYEKDHGYRFAEQESYARAHGMLLDENGHHVTNLVDYDRLPKTKDSRSPMLLLATALDKIEEAKGLERLQAESNQGWSLSGLLASSSRSPSSRGEPLLDKAKKQ